MYNFSDVNENLKIKNWIKKLLKDYVQAKFILIKIHQKLKIIHNRKILYISV
jgi:hypothetical protein